MIFFFQAEDGIRDIGVTGVQTCALPIFLFNCAGFVHQNTALTCTDEEWEFAFALNVRAMWKAVRAALPAMLERRRGSIINMASACSSVKGAPNRFLYGTTRSEEHTSELQSRQYLVCRLL